MYKKSLKSLKKLSNCSNNKKTIKNVKDYKNFTIETIIGASNVKRWNSLKTLFSCDTNEKFINKLLDLAQEHIERNKYKENDNKKTNSNNNDNKSTKESQCTTANKTETKHKPLLEKNTEKTDTISPIVTNNVEITTNVTVENNKKKLPPSKKKVNDIRKAPELNIQIENTSAEKSPQNNTAIVADIKVKLCQNCGTRHIQDHCPLNYPNFVIPNNINYEDWEENFKDVYYEKIKSNDGEYEDNSFAKMSLPNTLKFSLSNLSSHGLGVFAQEEIQEFTQLGPLCGKIVKEVDIPEDSTFRDLWMINQEEGNIYYNTEDWTQANWMRFVRPAPTRDEKNVTAIVRQNLLYFVTVQTIKAGDELLYWQDTLSAIYKKKMEKTTCGGCNMTFAHPIYYRTHCSVFHDVRYSLTIRKYHCKICGTAVLGKENIMKHAADLHNGQGAYQCQYCKKFFLRLNYLEMHRTYGCSANPHRSRPLCDFCGRKFCQPQKLKVHIKRMHSDFSEVLKEFQCKVCLKILGSRAALQRHLKEVHQKVMDGTCSCIKCGKNFQNKSNLKIHMLTHSGIKPFRCAVKSCNAAFTTKQCLQFHYKKVHNFSEDIMPKIERSIDYTFEAYSGLEENEDKTYDKNDSNENNNDGSDDEDDDDNDDDDGDDDNDDDDNDEVDDNSDNESEHSIKIDDGIQQNVNNNHQSLTNHNNVELSNSSSPNHTINYNNNLTSTKILSKGSKKWIGEPLPSSYQLESQYRTTKNLNEFNRHETSNASLLVEAALDSVCNEQNIDINVTTTTTTTTTNCTNSLNNLYIPTDTLTDVTSSYNDNVNRDINLISPSVNDHISVTDELNDELRNQNQNIMDYSTFNQQDFSPTQDSPSQDIENRTNFVRNYIDNSLSPHHYTSTKSPQNNVPSPPRYDFGGHTSTVCDHLSSDSDSNGGMGGAQNLTLHSKQLDLTPIYKRKMYQDDLVDDIQIQDKDNIRPKYLEDLSSSSNNDIRNNKFDIDLDLRIKNYEENDFRIRHLYDNNNYDNNNIEQSNDFRNNDRNFEPLIINSELQGLDMSARSLQYPNINRYHHLYQDIDRVDLRLNYSPPPPTPYTHADILRVVSLDLTSSGRHSVDLSLRTHPLQIHSIQQNHRLFSDSRLLDGGRILSDHSTNRILCNNNNNDQLTLLTTDETRLLDQSRLINDGRILTTTNPSNGNVSPVTSFTGYPQNHYPTPLPPRSHVTSPNPYHPYTGYY